MEGSRDNGQIVLGSWWGTQMAIRKGLETQETERCTRQSKMRQMMYLNVMQKFTEDIRSDGVNTL